MNKLLSLTFASLVACTGLAGAADDLFAVKVLVKADGFEITEKQLDDAYTQRKAQMAAMQRTIPENLRPAVEKETLDLLILKYTLLGMATPEDKVEAGKIVDQTISNAPAGSLGMQAKLLGLSEEQFKQELIDQNTAARVVEREFKPKVVVSDEAARTFYNENLSKFEAPEMVRAAHILFMTVNPQTGQPLSEDEVKAQRALAEKILERARKGEDFAALAKEYSEDPGSKDNGGEYTFPRGKMVPEFDSVAWTLTPGGISEIVTTQFGYHIIKKYEVIPAKVQPFEEVEANIKEFLAGKELQTLLQNYVADLRKSPSIQILDDRYK